MVHLRSHTVHARLAHGAGASVTHGTGGWDRRGTAGRRHVGGMRAGRHRLAVVHLGHAADASTPQPRVLVAVAPAVHGPLDQASLAPERRVQLRERPSDRVALGLVLQTVAAVLVLRAAGARIDAVFRLELGRQLLRVHRLDVASDGVLHLDAIARVLERDPLDAVLVLPDHQGRGGGDWAGCSVRVDTRSRGARCCG